MFDRILSIQAKDKSTVAVLEDAPIVIAGPCSVESEEQLFACAKEVKLKGGTILRGGAYKPRTDPLAFKGLGLDALKLLKAASEEYDLPVISEVMEISQLSTMLKYVDILQVGSRNMYNYDLLREIGNLNVPVLLKRGISATIKE